MSQPLFDPSPLITDRHNVVMAAGTDSVEAVDDSVSSGDVKSHNVPAQNTHTSMSHYLGLPYQDHNYGQPPPPTPPQSPPPIQNTIPDLPISSEFENVNPNITPPEDNADSLKDEGVTRCICNLDHDDGYMICCDQCLVWQHVECMGLDRNNIPEVYFCERCQPRMVDQQRAIALQTVKRKQILERLESNKEETKRKSRKTRYSSISNTPTSVTLTSVKTKNKLKKKKKKKEKEKERLRKQEEDEREKRQEAKHHKKKKKKKRKHRRNRMRNEPAIGDLLLHGEQVLETAEHFVEASENRYSIELNEFLAAQRQNPTWSMPSLGCVMDDLSPQKIRLGTAGRTARGLIATEELAPNQPIVEYRGMLMLRNQLVPSNGWTKKPYLHVLVYTKLSNVELCVDARKYGNIARYVRKSCSPNAEVRHVAIDGLLRLYLFALVEIPKGTEVTVGFDFSYKDSSHPVKCACAKKSCPVKRYWKKRRALDARHQRKPPSDPHASVPTKRTVSPLRVSLTAANNAEKRVETSIQHDEPPKLIKEESTPTTNKPSHPSPRQEMPAAQEQGKTAETSDSEHKERVDVVGVDSGTPSIPPVVSEKENVAGGDGGGSGSGDGGGAEKEESGPPRKLTREERKMEAIMKAFAKMEKAQERRQQALDRIAQSKGQTGSSSSNPTTTTTSSSSSSSSKSTQGPEKEQHCTGTSQQKQQQQPPPPPPSLPEPQQLKQAQEQPKETQQQTDVKQEDTSSAGAQKSDSVSQSDSGKEEQPKANETKTKESSNIPAPPSRKARRRRRSSMSTRRRSRHNSMASVTTSVEVSSADDDSNLAPPSMGDSERSSYPSTPLSVSTTCSSQDKADAPLSSPGSSNSRKRFTFPKTKKFFMNEWYNEKAFETLAGKPLTIKTEQLDSSYSSNLSSPSTPLLQRSGSLSAIIKDSAYSNLDSSGGLGSAKKRWLRQAMSEGNSNQDSAPCNGTLSPIASPALSPNTSASSDMMTPLKKRMLRHPLTEDAVSGSASPKHEARSGPDPSSVAAPATNPDGVPSEEPPILIQGKTELETVVEEDERKNSSIDSGLSVTTPAELEKSPGGIKKSFEDRLRDFSGEEAIVPEAEKERLPQGVGTTDQNGSEVSSKSSAVVSAGNNNNIIKEEETEKDGGKEDVKSKAELDASDDTDGGLKTRIEGRTLSPGSDKTPVSDMTVDTSVEETNVASVQQTSVAAPSSLDTSSADAPVEPRKDAQLCRVEDLKSRSLTDVTKGEHPNSNSLYVNNLRTRHMSGPVAVQGHKDESGPLTLNTSFSDDSAFSNSNLYTPFSPKKRLLRQNTELSEHAEVRPSMASSWPQQSFGSPQRPMRPKDESFGPNQPGEPSQTDAGSTAAQGSALGPLPTPGKLSASWTSGMRPAMNGSGTSPRALEPGATQSPSPSPGPPAQIPPPPGSVKPGVPAAPASAVRDLGNSLASVSVANQESAESVMIAQSSVTTSTASSEESGSASSSAQSTPVKKKVSLLEYRKRRSSIKPASSSSSSTSTTTSTSITASLVGATTPGSGAKLPSITLPNIPLPDITPVDPLKDESSKKPSKTPTAKVTSTSTSSSPQTANPALKVGGKLTGSPRKGEDVGGGKPGEPGSNSSTANTSKSGFALFSTKTEDGQKPTLTLTNEAQQVINSITSLLMEESCASNGDIKERSIHRSDSAPGDSRFMRRGFNDKPWEKDGRGDAAGSLKRPLSPEPPPPPPGKKLCTGPVAPVPPPPPPKGGTTRESRLGENGPALPLRQNSAPGGAVPVANSPLKTVTGNNMVPTQYGIAHRGQNQQYPVQYGQQPQNKVQQQYAPNAYHQQRPMQPQPPQPPQQQSQQQPQQPPRPGLLPQKQGNFNYQYSTQPAEKGNASGYPQSQQQQQQPQQQQQQQQPQQQQQLVGYPQLPYRQNQTQPNNHYQGKFPSNGRKSPYGSQDSNRQVFYNNRGSSNTYNAQNFHSH